MTVDEICSAANRNDELPKDIPLHDQLLFLAVRHVYNDYRDGRIEREQAVREKNHLLYQHDLWTRSAKMHLESARRYQAVTIATEGARADFMKLMKAKAAPERIVSAANRMVEIWDGTRRALEGTS